MNNTEFHEYSLSEKDPSNNKIRLVCVSDKQRITEKRKRGRKKE